MLFRHSNVVEKLVLTSVLGKFGVVLRNVDPRKDAVKTA